MKTVSTLLLALSVLFSTGCDTKDLVQQAESGLGGLGKTIGKLGQSQVIGGGNDSGSGGLGTQPTPPNEGNPGHETTDSFTAPNGSLSCGEVVDCAAECESEACVDQCLSGSAEHAIEPLINLVECLNYSGCTDEACLELTCAQPINSCYGGGDMGYGGEYGGDDYYGDEDFYGNDDEDDEYYGDDYYGDDYYS